MAAVGITGEWIPKSSLDLKKEKKKLVVFFLNLYYYFFKSKAGVATF